MARPAFRFQPLLLITCGVGLSCAAVVGSTIGAPPAAQATSMMAQVSQPQKASPFAAPKDEATSPTPPGASAVEKKLGGTRAAGTTKDSPFAGAKETESATSAPLRVDRSRLWWLLLPAALAGVIYGVLRSQDAASA